MFTQFYIIKGMKFTIKPKQSNNCVIKETTPKETPLLSKKNQDQKNASNKLLRYYAKTDDRHASPRFRQY